MLGRVRRIRSSEVEPDPAVVDRVRRIARGWGRGGPLRLTVALDIRLMRRRRPDGIERAAEAPPPDSYFFSIGIREKPNAMATITAESRSSSTPTVTSTPTPSSMPSRLDGSGNEGIRPEGRSRSAQAASVGQVDQARQYRPGAESVVLVFARHPRRDVGKQARRLEGELHRDVDVVDVDRGGARRSG